MTDADYDTWREANREYLTLAIDALQRRMDALATLGATDAADEADAVAAAAAESMSYPPALERVVEAFELGPFERTVVLACAAFEVDPGFGGDRTALTVAGALQTLPGAHWSAFDGSESLRAWRIVEIDPKAPLADAVVRLSADVTGFIIGFSIGPATDGTFDVVEPPHAALESQQLTAVELARAMTHATAIRGRIPVLEFHGASSEERLVLAALTTDALDGTALHRVDARDLPTAAAELDAAVTRWNRFARLADAHLLVTCKEDPAGDRALRRLIAQVDCPLFVSTQKAREAPDDRQLLRHRVVEATLEERLELWGTIVGASLERLGLRSDPEFDTAVVDMAARFHFTEPVVDSICLAAEALVQDDPGTASLAALLRRGCRQIVRARLDGVAEFVPIEGDEVVVLPEVERAQLDELIDQIDLAPILMAPGGRRQGVVALFAGPSGTGKTHAARAVARATRLDLYRVDVSSVLSKYIGETEQNLEAVFEAAELGGAILLFDEADALFGKRSEVRDSHDRYANIGTSYLLQRIERAPAPAILTTNLRDAIDPAFTRRVQIIVEFPFPTEQTRREIWAQIFPAGVDASELDPDELSDLGATGGTIMNVARRATFMAAVARTGLTMEIVRESARRDARQTGRELAEVDVL